MGGPKSIVGWDWADLKFSRLVAGVIAGLLLALLVWLGASVISEIRQQLSSDRIYSACDRYLVYGQRRWDPIGAAIRSYPSLEGDKVGSLAGNEAAAVDGWISGPPIYPDNGDPFDSGVWFHLADDRGWVSFPGVRAQLTDYAPGDLDGGPPAPTPAECEIDESIDSVIASLSD